MMQSTRVLAVLSCLAGIFPVAISAAVADATSGAASAQTSAHQRLLPLEGGRNFRDLGGYRTQDGRTVKWGLLFRSGAMHGLTPADFAYLGRLNIRTVCDFRDVHERASEPVAWPSGRAPTVLADNYDLAQTSMVPMKDMGQWDEEKARQVMAATYPRLLTTFNSQYRRMFQQLLGGQVPLAFNCTAGKDRTGVAAALLLTALGVPRETVVQDYLLTNQYLDSVGLLKTGAVSGDWAKLPPPVMKAFAAADRSYIEAALAVLDRHPDGPGGYLRDEMQLSASDIQRLRSLYLE